MGRHYTGACSTSEVRRIDLTSLFKLGYLQAGCSSNRYYSWSRGDESAGEIVIESNLDLAYIRLIYTLTDSDGKKTHRDYRISLVSRPSNLGKGKVYYFLCPVSGKPCRVLYSAYGSEYFKSREAYKNRLYYDSQRSGRLDNANDAYWTLEKALFQKRPKQRRAYYYDGKPTKRYLKQERDIKRLVMLDDERWSQSSMPKKLWSTISNRRD